MALSEAPVRAPLAALAERELADALALSDAAGWNQTEADWRLFLRHGDALAIRDPAGRVVATAATFPYAGESGARTAWISMVLVADGWRHRGLATRLVDDCIARLQALPATPCLDATPDGAAVYRRLGFEPGFEIERWQRAASAPAAADRAGAVRVAAPGDAAPIAGIDRAATGLERRLLIDAFLARPDTVAWRSGDDGFLIARAGRRATQLGPLAASSEAQAIGLLEAALAELAGADWRPVFLDVPVRWRGLADWLSGAGFARQRPFVRMSLGGAEPPRCGDTLFVLAGPEFG